MFIIVIIYYDVILICHIHLLYLPDWGQAPNSEANGHKKKQKWCKR